jgi:hypothetical protein
MYTILCVVDDTGKLDAILDAWRNAGILGITIIESTGLHRLRLLPRIPMRYAFGDPNEERGNLTIFAVVEDETYIQRGLEATESVVGDLSGPNTGIFIAWPLVFAKGIDGKNLSQGIETDDLA